MERWVALAGGALLLTVAVRRRSAASSYLAASSAPLLYRGITGQWPGSLLRRDSEDTKTALTGDRGVHVRESVRLELPVTQVYRFWRQLENLPRFMPHLASVDQISHTHSEWVATGPVGRSVSWNAEIINEIEDHLLAWRSLPGSDIVTAGSVRFEPIRGGRGTQVTVHLQYAPPAGRAGAVIAKLFGSEPSQTIRQDLRRLKQLLEAGEIPRATAE